MLRFGFEIMNKTKLGLYDITARCGRPTIEKCLLNLAISGFSRGNNDWMECCKMR